MEKYKQALQAVSSDSGSALSRKISRRILKILLTFTVGAVLALSIAEYFSRSSRLEARADRLVKLVSLSASQPLWDFNDAALSQLVDAVKLDEDVTFVSILNENGSEKIKRGEPEAWRLLTARAPIMRAEKRIGETMIAFSPRGVLIDIATGILIIIIGSAVICVILLVLLGGALRELIHEPVAKLSSFARDIGHGNMHATVDLSTGDELEDLGETMARMLGRLREFQDQLVLESKTVREMELARNIQTALLPQEFKNPYFEIVASMTPAEKVGGDYYDVIQTDDMLWFIIGDVSGHGITSGMIAMMVQTSVASILRRSKEMVPLDLIGILNDIISENLNRMGENKYMTLTIFACRDGRIVQYVGLHQDILIYRVKSNEVITIETDGLWIGLHDFPVDMASVLEPGSVEMDPGDLMVLYSDGITEAANANDEMYGAERLQAVIRKLGREGAQAVHDGVIADVQSFMKLQDDDITLMVLQKLP